MSEKRALITGITGFAGSHLAEYLLGQGYTIYGTIRSRLRSPTENIEGFADRITLLECDIRDAGNVMDALCDAGPEEIYHLAAQSFVPTSWHSPSETLTTNIIGELNLLEAICAVAPEARVQIAGSSEEYGQVYECDMPIMEACPLHPLSPYGVSKVAQDLLGYQYHKSYGLKIVRTRAFNHTGPRRGACFVTSNFCRQVALIEKGKQEPIIRVGNLDAVRDFTDVRDMVRAYHLAVTKGESGEVYNICSEQGRTIEAVLNIILAFTETRPSIQEDPTRMRPSDVAYLVGDCTKFKQATGWEPEIGFAQTIRDLLDYWRERV